MKTLKILFVLISFCYATKSEAQFFKKLKKRAEEAVKETVIRKTEEKTSRETEKTFDTVFNNKGRLFKSKKVKVAESYTFSHQYTMEIISDKDTTDITYYLTNENDYMATSFSAREDQEFLTVIDLSNSAIHSFMDLGGKKSMTSMKIELDDVNRGDLNTSKFHIASTGQTKKILGYQCEEFQVTGPKLSGKVWVTQEADISFYKAFSQLRSKKFKNVKGMDQSWISLVEGLALEMKMIDYSRKKPKPIEIICTGISENDFTIETAQYQNQF